MKFVKPILKYVLAIAFVAAGANHFFNPPFYLRIMPPVLPAPLFLIYLSGVLEIAFGAMLLIKRYSRLAAWLLIALLIAVFPANIYMAAHTELFSEFSPLALYLRLPVQFIIIAWAYRFTKDE